MASSSVLPGLANAEAYGLPSVRALAASAKTPQAVERAAKEFESVFLAQMLEPMFAGVSFSAMDADEEEGGMDIYRSWMLEQYGKLIVNHGGIGVADIVKKEMLKLQEISHE